MVTPLSSAGPEAASVVARLAIRLLDEQPRATRELGLGALQLWRPSVLGTAARIGYTSGPAGPWQDASVMSPRIVGATWFIRRVGRLPAMPPCRISMCEPTPERRVTCARRRRARRTC